MARRYAAVVALLLSLGTFAAAQDLGKLLVTGGACDSGNPCFAEVNMPEQCCQAEYLYTITQGVGQAISMLSNDTNIICSDACRDIVLGPFKKCLIKQLGNYTVEPTLPDDFCGIDCVFDVPGLNIQERDVYDCSTLEDIPVECRYNLTKNSKAGDLFNAAFENCNFDPSEYLENGGLPTAAASLAAVAAGVVALAALMV